MTAHTCHTCGGEFAAHDLRPYGPGGSPICFDCGTGTPEAEARARAAFLAQLAACGPVAVIHADAGDGPVPAPGAPTH